MNKQPAVPSAPRGALRTAPTLRATVGAMPAAVRAQPGVSGALRALPVLRSR